MIDYSIHVCTRQLSDADLREMLLVAIGEQIDRLKKGESATVIFGMECTDFAIFVGSGDKRTAVLRAYDAEKF